GVYILCPVTLEGSFTTNTLPVLPDETKPAPTVGYVTRAVATTSTPPCYTQNVGAWTPLTGSVPWAVKYHGSWEFPNYTSIGISIVGMAFLWSYGGISCLYRSVEAGPELEDLSGLERGSGGVIDAMNPEIRLSKSSGGSLCPEHFSAYEAAAA